jgi:hypothetical protein
MPSFLIERKANKYKAIIQNMINGNINSYSIKKSDYSLVVSLIRKRKDFQIVHRLGYLILKYIGQKGAICQ